MSAAEEVDAAILRILLDSEHGRQWLEQRGEQFEMESSIKRLIGAGLDGRLADELWHAGNPELVRRVAELSVVEIAILNGEWREREDKR